jgi:hypothetical protein
MDIGILYVVFNKWIKNPDSNEIPYKIGITRGSVEDRYYGLGLKMPGKFETLFAYEFDLTGFCRRQLLRLKFRRRKILFRESAFCFPFWTKKLFFKVE